MNMTDVSPDRNDPFPNRSFADIVTSIEEAPTGAFMIGVGANSFQGLIGNLQIFEKNFDITNFPRSFSDIVNGHAFRGGGQSLDDQPSGRQPHELHVDQSARALSLRSADRSQRLGLPLVSVFIRTGMNAVAADRSRWAASSEP